MSKYGETLNKWIVPEMELVKLAHLKRSELFPNPTSQPDYYIKQKNSYEDKEKEWELYRAEKGRGLFMSEKELSELATNKYYQYLQTSEYRERAKQALIRDKFQCQLCETGKNVVVHHVTYRRLGNEELDDLVTLCDKCHYEVHRKDLLIKKNNHLDNTEDNN